MLLWSVHKEDGNITDNDSDLGQDEKQHLSAALTKCSPKQKRFKEPNSTHRLCMCICIHIYIYMYIGIYHPM